MADQPAAQDPEALPPELQAAVDAARVPRSWTDFPPEALEGLVAHASADPAWDEEAEKAKVEVAGPEDLEIILDQLWEALDVWYGLVLVEEQA